MNDRIKQFAVQAQIGLFEDKSFGWSVIAGTDQHLSKFAELIVRECARALDDKLANPNGASMAWCDGSDLLEHFGVEE